MFKNGMKETGQTKIMIFVEKRAQEAFKKVIESLYTGVLETPLSSEIILQILELADQYDLPETIQLGIDKMKSTIQSAAVCSQVCDFVSSSNVKSAAVLLKACAAWLDTKFEDFDATWETDDFMNLSFAALRTLLESGEWAVSTENVGLYLAKCVTNSP
eukprot:TRINITY_DN4523_c0_g1_i1.p1 TRINITY_DN4523_c0_g1~~TRINITY_DN4523_c0_g1_i1.p1  ORF type:complete len:159 (+),score=8.23 TRINITY_DN4523_c0_g1_i1:345-821(+)